MVWQWLDTVYAGTIVSLGLSVIIFSATLQLKVQLSQSYGESTSKDKVTEKKHDI